MESFGYSPMEINAVLKGKAAKSGSSEVIQCYYCATVGHRRNECGQLEEDTKKGQIRPDKCGPRAGQAPHVESLSKKKPNAKEVQGRREKHRCKEEDVLQEEEGQRGGS